MRTLFEYKKFIQPPSMPGKLVLEDEYYKLNIVVPEKVLIKATRDGLYETMQEKLTLNTTTIIWYPNITQSITTICSSISLDPMTTHMPTAEEPWIWRGKRSRKPHNIKQYSAPFARELGYCTPITPPTLIDTAIVWSIRRIILAAALMTATLSLRSSRNRINPGIKK